MARPRDPLVAATLARRSASWVSSCLGVKARSRAAASSMPSGKQSTRSQIDRTVPSSSPTTNLCWASTPRAAKRVTASSIGNGSSWRTVSPTTSSTTRLVVRMRSSGQRCNSAEATVRTSPSTCSQLSSTSSIAAPPIVAAAVSMAVDRSTVAVVASGCPANTVSKGRATPSGPEVTSSSNIHAPCPHAAARRRASSEASRVLPTPPGPMIDTNRRCARTSPSASRSAPRPTSELRSCFTFVTYAGAADISTSGWGAAALSSRSACC